MRSDPHQGSRRRRGGRRHRGPRPDRGESTGSRRSTPSDKAPEKLGFFQKIIAFFTGKKPSRPVPGKVYGRVIDSPVVSTSNGHRSESSDAPREQRNRAPRENRENREPREETREPRPVRKPELVEVTSPKLYVGNLSFDASESDLSELFSGVGQVQSSEVVCHRETQRSKGFAFITMCTVEEAKRAVDELHDKEYMGRRLVVSGAKTSDVR